MQKREHHWEAVTGDSLGLFAIGMALFLALLAHSTPGFIFVVDHANVIFREVGHTIVGVFRPDLQAFGGAIAQIALPIIMIIGFQRNGSPLGFATALVWFSENLLNIAHILLDPGAKSPPLIGGADHDWAMVFGHFGLLRYENEIASAMVTAAWAGMGLACLFVLWRAWQGRRTVAVGRFAAAR